ncbi:MAG: zinc ribbon domain-containing protein [Clostridiaceae bacterium]|mgnify:CR=1 FL=1|nr:zinc ribbon domain-containing protein [Clostridiaceae bacterium]
MPFYDMKCKCGNEFNIMAKMSEMEQKLIKCTKCGSNDLSVVFKNINIVQSRKSGDSQCPNMHRCGSGCCGH